MGKRKSRSLSPCHTVNKEQKLSSTTERGSSSAERPQRDYQVFLSFRGRDTRRGFVDSLYHFLVDAGVRVFLDNKALYPGDRIREILAAINRSQVCIPIFSENYAESKWCLLELAEMVKLEKVIMPIFYNVKAEDVKLKTDLYRNQLRNFREKYEDKKVEWEKALEQVGASFDTTQLERSLADAGQIQAWDITQCSGDGQLCKKVVEEILIKLEVKHKILDGSLVGIDHHVDAMRNLLDVRSSDVRFIVIHGMGGVGKTTLAKFIYNELRNRDGGFDCCCFLDDVRETTNSHGIVYLQNKLLRHLSRGTRKIDNKDSGINSIKDVVKNKKVLIILDDLDQHEQIESLAGDSTWFYSGSRIITTTRDASCVVRHVKVRDNDEVHEYSISEMSPNNALQLFSIHAFKQESPPADYLHISKEVVAACGHLPLALEVMGSYLFHIDKKFWKSHVHEIVSHKHIHDKLIISYKALDLRAKEIFLDIACFFVGSETKYAIYMWEACDFRPDERIECLSSMSLVKISEDNTFWMHDLLRDLGREIVIQENLKRPERRSRLWSHDETERVLSRGKGTSEIDALRFAPTSEDELGSSNSPLKVNHVKPLQNLRFLELSKTSIEGDFNDALQDLKWFACQDSEMFDVTNLELKDLIVLDLSSSVVRPNVLERIKIGKHLKVLNLSHCSSGRNGCDLVLPEALGSLSSLVELDVSFTDVKKMPKSIGNLKNLRVIKMDGSHIRELPSSIGDLKMLEELHAGLSSLESIPDDIGRLHQLRILDLSCSEIRELPNLPSSLTDLHVSHSLLKLPNLLNLKRLKHLSLGNRKSIIEDDDTSLMENTSWVSDCPLLESFEFSFRGITRIHMETAAFSCLKKLHLFCRDIEVIGQLPLSLTELRLTYIMKEVSFPTCLREMEALNFLELSGCRFVGELSLPRHLKTLRIYDCSLPQPVIDLSGLRMLQYLEIKSCEELVEVRGVENTEFLERVSVFGCKSLKEISDLSRFERLTISTDDIELFRGIKYIITKQECHPVWGDTFEAMTAGSVS